MIQRKHIRRAVLAGAAASLHIAGAQAKALRTGMQATFSGPLAGA